MFWKKTFNSEKFSLVRNHGEIKINPDVAALLAIYSFIQMVAKQINFFK